MSDSKGQSKKMSIFESIFSVVGGYLLTVIIQYFIYPFFGIHISMGKTLFISILIVFASFLKNYTVRRVFNRLHEKGVS
ncbi:MAG: hypothetical protein ACI86H_001562 [bacterium]|jgi:hypothetical protein